MLVGQWESCRQCQACPCFLQIKGSGLDNKGWITTIISQDSQTLIMVFSQCAFLYLDLVYDTSAGLCILRPPPSFTQHDPPPRSSASCNSFPFLLHSCRTTRQLLRPLFNLGTYWGLALVRCRVTWWIGFALMSALSLINHLTGYERDLRRCFTPHSVYSAHRAATAATVVSSGSPPPVWKPTHDDFCLVP